MHIDVGAPLGAGLTQPPAAPNRRRRDEGMVLLEAALAIPILLLIALAGLATVRLAVGELAVDGAARDAAIQAARGARQDAVAELVRRRLPDADVIVVGVGGDVRVSVAASTSLVPGVGRVTIRHEASYLAVREPGT